MNDHDTKELLVVVAKQQQELIKNLQAKQKKDVWDQLTAISPILSAILIASIGAYFTYSYNQQQLKLQEMQTIERFIPHLTGTEKSKRLAILAISSLANAQLAGKVASIFASEGTVSALQSIAESGNVKERSIANNALAQTLEKLSKDYEEDNKYEQALAASIRALSIKQGSLGPDHNEVLEHMNKLASLYTDHGDHAKAEEVLVKVLNAKKRLSGLTSGETIAALRNLSEFYVKQGNAAKADMYMKQALLAARKSTDSEEDNDRANVLSEKETGLEDTTKSAASSSVASSDSANAASNKSLDNASEKSYQAMNNSNDITQ